MKNKFFKLLVLTFLLLVSVIGLVACGGGGTEGLEFRVDKENKEAVLLGVGDAEDVNIVIPEKYEGCTVVEIAKEAFKGELKIRSVSIPKTIKKIGDNAFTSCEDLESVTFADGIEIEELGKGVFSNCDMMESFVIPNGLPKISDSMFSGCEELVSIELPESLTEIGKNAFHTCPKLESVTIPSGVKVVGDNAFLSCSGLKSVIFSDGVEVIEDNAFQYCENLETVTFSNTLESIGVVAFYHCKSLTEITLPASLATIKTKAFEGCTKLATVNQSPNNSLVHLGDFAFNSCPALQSISLKEGMYVGESAFYGCNSLQYKVENGLKYLGNAQNPYLYLIDLDLSKVDFGNVKISEQCYEIGADVFVNQPKLKSITIPASVKIISINAFASCTELETVTFKTGSQLKSVGNGAFNGCTSLKSIVIPEGTKIIGRLAFNYCYRLASITLPSTIEEIYARAFSTSNSSLKKINFNGTTSQWNSISLNEDWNYDSSLTEIICSNGTVKIGN